MSTSIAVVEQPGLVAPSREPDSSILAVMERLATNPSLDADKIEKLFNVFIEGQRRMRLMSDEQEFSHRMAEFKKNPPEIIKGRTAKMQNKEKTASWEVPYADLDAYCKEAMPGLAAQGITWSFPFSEAGNIITVSCVLRYGLYNHTPSTLSAAPDSSGAKNEIQAKGSAVAYLERYTFCGATGLTAAMPDNDGNRTGVSKEEIDRYLKAIGTAPDADALKKVYFEADKAAKAVHDAGASRTYAEAKNTRYKEIARA